MGSDFFPFQTPVGPTAPDIGSLALTGAQVGARLGQQIQSPLTAAVSGMKEGIAAYQQGVEFEQRTELNRQTLEENRLKLEEERALQAKEIEAKKQRLEAERVAAAEAIQLREQEDQFMQVMRGDDSYAKVDALISGKNTNLFAKYPNYEKVAAQAAASTDLLTEDQKDIYLENAARKQAQGLLAADLKKHYENYQTATKNLIEDSSLSNALQQSAKYKDKPGAALLFAEDIHSNKYKRFPQDYLAVDPMTGKPKVEKGQLVVNEGVLPSVTGKEPPEYMYQDVQTGLIVAQHIPAESIKKIDEGWGAKNLYQTASNSYATAGDAFRGASKSAARGAVPSVITDEARQARLNGGTPPQTPAPSTPKASVTPPAQSRPQIAIINNGKVQPIAIAASASGGLSVKDFKTSLSNFNVVNDNKETQEVTATLIASALNVPPQHAQTLIPKIKELIGTHYQYINRQGGRTAPTTVKPEMLVREALLAEFAVNEDTYSKEFNEAAVKLHNERAAQYKARASSLDSLSPASDFTNQKLYAMLARDGTMEEVATPADLYAARFFSRTEIKLNELLNAHQEAIVAKLSEPIAASKTTKEMASLISNILPTNGTPVK